MSQFDFVIGESSSMASSSKVQGVNEKAPIVQKKRKAPKPRSEVWEHFERYTSEEGDKMSKCNYCGKTYHSDPKLNGTTNLRTHISVCKKNPLNIPTNQTRLAVQVCHTVEEGSGSLRTWKFDQENVRKALAMMVISDEMPFKHVEAWGFKHFMSQSCPMFKIPSRWTLTRDCFQFYLDERALLKEVLKKSCNRVCLTTDTWTSIQRINYMCLTAHFIDENWRLHKRVINFCPIYSHRGEQLGQQVEKCLVEWGITSIFTVTVDNASSNNGVITYLQKKFAKRGGSVLGGRFMHMRCIAHIINLIVQDGIKETGDSVHHIRAAVKYIRQSPARLQKFKECIEIEKIESKSMLCLDVPTRWNSTYLMLSSALKFERAFERYEELDTRFKGELEKEDDDSYVKRGVLNEGDWENAKRLHLFLEKFYELTVRISGSLYVTSNAFFHEIAEVLCILNAWQVDDDPDVRNMATKMRAKFDKYWGSVDKMNLNIYLAVVLDPRFKLRYVEFAIRDMYEGTDGATLAHLVRLTCFEMFEDYKLRIGGESQYEGVANTNLLTAETPSDMKVIGVRYSMVEKFKRHNFGKVDFDSKTDLDKYLAEESEAMQDNFDILNWWKVNELRFPILSQMARDILAVPISTVASESVFSTGGRVLDAFRSSLSPRIVQALICAQDWMRAKWTTNPINIEENITEIDKFDEDLAKISSESQMSLFDSLDL